MMGECRGPICYHNSDANTPGAAPGWTFGAAVQRHDVRCTGMALRVQPLRLPCTCRARPGRANGRVN